MIKGHSIIAASLALGVAMVTSIAVGATSDCRMFQVAELPVRLTHNKLIVDGELNGHKIGIVLDTGATRTLIFRSAAERLGLRRDRVRGVRMFGIGGETDVESTLVDEIKIGKATRKSWRMLVGGEHEFGEDMDVLLGNDFFHNLDVEFDLSHAAVRLYQPKDCDGVSLAYWAPNIAQQVDLEPVDESRPQMRFTVKVNGQPLRALLDSGAGISLLDSSTAANLGVTPSTPGVVAVGAGSGLGRKKVEYWIGPFQSFSIGDERIADTSIVFGDLFRDAKYAPQGSQVMVKVGGAAAMLLGVDFLRAHRMLVANSQRKIYFTYAGGPVFQRVSPPPAVDTGR
ncbi:MAG: hypothetical protein E6H66_24140 [Betaproteobacteria bacterium]|nr:MAG: hypothetical protein E6H66_24140 [Betaproteobacteria bacterium]